MLDSLGSCQDISQQDWRAQELAVVWNNGKAQSCVSQMLPRTLYQRLQSKLPSIRRMSSQVYSDLPNHIRDMLERFMSCLEKFYVAVRKPLLLLTSLLAVGLCVLSVFASVYTLT